MSAIQVDLARSSPDCIDTTDRLIEPPNDNDAILETEFAKNYTDIMWERVKWQVVWNAAIDSIFTVLLTVMLLFYKNSFVFHLVL